MKYLLLIVAMLISASPISAAKRKGYSAPTGYVDGRSRASVTHSPQPLKIAVFHIDDGYSSRHPQFPTGANVDTTTYLDSDGTLIAQDFIGQDGDALGWSDDEYISLETNGVTRLYGATGEAFPVDFGAGYTTYMMYWANLAQFRTDHGGKALRIKSARLGGWLNSTNQSDAQFYGFSDNYRDGFHCVMDTIPEHAAWLAGDPGGGCDSCGDLRYRDASWNLADNDTPGAGAATVGWGSTLPWDDPGGGAVWFDAWWRLGIKSTNPIYEVDGDVDDPFYFDVTESVQQYMCNPDMTNAGWFLFATYTRGSHVYPHFGPVSTTNKRMFLVIEYYDEPHSQRWNGYPLAVVLTFDDQHDEQLTFSSMLDSIDWGCSIMTIKNELDDLFPDGTWPRLSVANLETHIGLNPLGVGGHTRWHMKDPHDRATREFTIGSPTTYRGFFSWGWKNSGDFGDTGYDADSMAIDIEVSWLDSTFSSKPRTSSYPSHHQNLQAQLGLNAEGYIGARGGELGRQAVDGPGVAWDKTGDYGAPANALRWYAIKADGAARRDMPTDLYSIGQFGSLCDLFGEWDETLTKAQIKENFYSIFVQAAVDSGYGAIVLMGHTIKTDQNSLCGVAPDELMLLGEIVEESGALWKCPSLETLFRWWRNPGFHQPVDAPTWDTEATNQSIVAADGLYWNITSSAKGVR